MAGYDNPSMQSARDDWLCRSFRVPAAVFMVGALIATCCGLGLPAGAGSAAEPVAAERINPNTAPAGSMMRLPGIGRVRATSIVDFRQNRSAKQPVFGRADDLQQIRGIGPVTAGRVEPYLVFDSNF